MKFKEINSYDDTLMNIVLKNRNINDIKLYKNVPEEYNESYKHLNNIYEGVDLYLNSIKNRDKIGIIIDCDGDGSTSSTEMYKVTKDIDKDAEIIMYYHKGKQHGITNDIVKKVIKDGIQLLISPDGGTSDIKNQELLNSNGIKVLVIDHHNVEDNWKETETIVINNQLSSNYKNKSMCGAGIVNKFIECIDEKLNTSYAEKYMDLAMLGNVADSMDARQFDTRLQIQKGFNNINNVFLSKMIDKMIVQQKKKVNIGSIGWIIAPRINAVHRNGTQKDKEMLFKAFANDDLDEEFYNQVIKMCNSCKTKQDNQRKKYTKEIKEKIENENLYENPILFIDCSDIIDDEEYKGLVANIIADEYNRPCIIASEKNKDGRIFFSGSARNYSGFEINNLNSYLQNTKLFNKIAGHDNAFGIEIDKNNIDKLNSKSKELVQYIDDEKTYNVDKIINIKDLKTKDILEIGNNDSLWGNGLIEPLFAVTNIIIPNSNIEQKKGNIIVVKINDSLKAVKMFACKGYYEKLAMKEDKTTTFGGKVISLDLVCKFKINEWNDKKYPQLEIVDFNVKEVDKKLINKKKEKRDIEDLW